jgi:hypothetical protein
MPLYGDTSESLTSTFQEARARCQKGAARRS